MRHANIAVFVPHLGCPCQCSFCNQRTISGATKQPTAQEVIDACEKAKQNLSGDVCVQLGFFGGSFTAIERDYMLSLLSAAQSYIKSGFLNGGIRISTRPDCIDEATLALLKAYGVKAIELGAQSTDDACLAANRRGHTAQDIADAARLIKASGFELGLQMMTGLYRSSREKDIQTALDFIELKPDTVRIYPTVVLPKTMLGELYLSGEYQPDTLEETVELCCELLDMFEQANINVIRLGLHAEDGVAKNYLAGGYHPALKELCQGEMFYKKIHEALSELPRGEYEIAVAAKCVSKAIGQKKKNINRLAELGYKCRVVVDNKAQNHEFTVRNVTKCF